MSDILYAPDQERVASTNAWAFLHWLRVVRGVDLAGWAALQRFSVGHATDFSDAVAAFSGLSAAAQRLQRRPTDREALVLRVNGARFALTGDPPPARAPTGEGRARIPTEIATILTRSWPAALLIRPLADLLLHADLRPDDRLLVVGTAWPWLAALREGTTVILDAPSDPIATAAQEHASVLVAPAKTLAEAAFQRRRRLDLSSLRTIVATGGPLSPEGRGRIYTYVKSDLLLLARTGDTVWGNPLEPVLARPPATPALFTPAASSPTPR